MLPQKNSSGELRRKIEGSVADDVLPQMMTRGICCLVLRLRDGTRLRRLRVIAGDVFLGERSPGCSAGVSGRTRPVVTGAGLLLRLPKLVSLALLLRRWCMRIRVVR